MNRLFSGTSQLQSHLKVEEDGKHQRWLEDFKVEWGLKAISLVYFSLAVIFYGQFLFIDKIPITDYSLFIQHTTPYFTSNLVVGSVSAIIALFIAYKIWQGLMFGWLVGLIYLITFYLNEMGLIIIKSLKVSLPLIIIDSLVIGVLGLTTYFTRKKFRYESNFLDILQKILLCLIITFQLLVFLTSLYL